MWLHVDPRSPQPMYQQVVDGVKSAVAKGILQPGDKLPAVRELSMELTLNHNTVAKAYQELERAGVIEVWRGRGTFIAASKVPADVNERKNELERELERILVEAHHLQMSEDEVEEMLRQVVRRLREGRGEHA
ncbi:GntR family transcriptional regulator [Alicyclobacillus sp. SO9]|uniref:GntR family transcriptional regulator n=1 Tax=Alicyclobacillus sp. SO9 TaxID=2665646 RepID=UPI0018E814F4|nr:GntR family transcriptional regulator [Alicyclobacillus sp. SO9]QQE77405.1 GntR family transcriptional regulator [Alicyclobacillus sp. SO9]